uniref:Uncharacterized protein n=1 Tax=Brassica oleracea TaxID=3712 RepID=A0A3P6H089_BRAOL|nr:unnamed protein product [Brassica oleracea]
MESTGKSPVSSYRKPERKILSSSAISKTPTGKSMLLIDESRSDSPVPFQEDWFRFRSHEEFEANCDLKVDLYDYLGHMKLRTIDETIHMGQSCSRFLPEVQVIWEDSKCYFSHHIESKTDWRNPCSTTMSSSRVFMDTDVQPTRDYLSWLGSNSDIAWKINAEIVTKPVAVTIAELFSYIKHENANMRMRRLLGLSAQQL